MSGIKNILTMTLVLLGMVMTNNIWAQDDVVYFEGRVAAYEQESFKLVKKMKKRFDYKGGMSGVRVEVSANRKNSLLKTGIDGSFKLELLPNHVYYVRVSKKGFSSAYVVVNTKKIPGKYFNGLNHFKGAEFILVKGDEYPKTEFLGSYYYSSVRRNFGFKPNRSSEENWVKNNIALAENAVAINYIGFKEAEEIDGEIIDTTDFEEDTLPVLVDTVSQQTEEIMDDLKKMEDFLLNSDQFSMDQVNDYTDMIEGLKEKIKIEKNNSDNSTMSSMLIANLEAELRFIEAQLSKSKEIIQLKEREIRNSRYIIWLGIALTVIMLASLVYLFTSLRFRKKQNERLETQNDQIMAQNKRIMDSLLFSASIQNAIFKSREKFSALFNKGIIFFKPKDIVSGDFYWFEKVGDTKIIAVADCTGHGVPGALLTMLGNSFLNEIVKVSKNVNPSSIIENLNTKLIDTFSDDKTQGIHGMDISIIAINEVKKELSFAGAMNSIYQIKGDNAIEHNSSLISLGMLSEVTIDNKVVDFEEGDSFFLFSDGYSDQFGGQNNEKLNKSKFEKVLVKASTEFDKGEGILSKYFMDWKKDNHQIDDVLILGVRL